MRSCKTLFKVLQDFISPPVLSEQRFLRPHLTPPVWSEQIPCTLQFSVCPHNSVHLAAASLSLAICDNINLRKYGLGTVGYCGYNGVMLGL